MHLSRALKIYAKKVKTPVQISLLDYYGKNRNDLLCDGVTNE